MTITVSARRIWVLVGFALASVSASVVAADPPASSDPALTPAESKVLSNLRQVTKGFTRAGEGYFSPDGKQICYQAYPLGYPFYQIYVQPVDQFAPRRISFGRGRTTCSYFSPDGKQILFASAHTDPDIDQTEFQARELEKQGPKRRYLWDFDPNMEIYVSDINGLNTRRLTDSPGYDAEGSFSHDGKQIVFTSSRSGDAEIYVMAADGSNVRRLTNAKGYDGGPFFSPDDQWIIFRSDRQKEHMLQLFAISADGQHETPLTSNLDQVNWCPYFHPSGKYLVWSGADYARGPMSANFDLFTAEIAQTATTFAISDIKQITDHEKADVLPVFSPDGRQLMWTSSRTADGSSQLWIADWQREMK